jgi:Arc/MetJ-type ribon-helix-helix transcriptional regulator
MSIGISLENEQYIDSTVASGLFQDRGQALNTAIELLKRRERLIRDVNHGIEQIEEGQGKPFDIDVIMGQIDDKLPEERD